MKLAICTDVFADLSYTEMLDKVKSLGIDAVEMTAGGWGARKHCNTKELLADGDVRPYGISWRLFRRSLINGG